ncbi:hypothetical protein QUF88_06980 [Bacillus sp. DX1.1]|uniref:hypothetical protein n=1 Tax=unclassified Bacillus (in: firmicutes) TaxID=185979 RepID=UPI00256FB4D5|nr:MULTISPECIES: hypothetical protein [unclassified Bacillus (in: firmicutes)]MDM5153582.1 hypothetical protein [Bacillus sp. DX1.1]WJE82533.1 hypothetical protein QRE67_04495 [Bacillus sp. DX3.1]
MKFEYQLTGLGWAEGIIEINNQEHYFEISYLTDGLGDFLNGLMLLNKYCVPDDECRENVSLEWNSEPAGTNIFLQLIEDNTLFIKVISYKDLNLKLSPEVEIETKCSYTEFLRNVIKEIDLLIKKYGIVGYRKTWYEHDFPLSTFLKLKHYIVNSKRYTTQLVEVYGDGLEKTDLQNDLDLLMMKI